MALDDDPWIVAKKLNGIEPAKLHALGVVTLNWNLCETALFWLFSDISGLPLEQSWVHAHDLGDIALIERIKALVKIKSFHPDTESAITNTLDVYDICRRNRNQLTHFEVVGIFERTSIARRSKKPDSPQSETFPNDLEDIRRVADDIKRLHTQLWLMTVVMEQHPPTEPAPWPPTLTEPELLWKPPQQVPTEPQPQRPPSVLRLTEEEWAAKKAKEAREGRPPE